MVFEWPMEDVDCAICGKSNIRKISNKGQFGEPANVVLCLNDGFVYLSPRWNLEGYNEYYSQKYSSIFPQFDNQEEVIAPHYGKVVERIKPYLENSPDEALSVGAGKGCVLRLLKENLPDLGCSVIEPSVECRKFLSENFGFSILGNDITDTWEDGNEEKYDIIILRHVLEHFLDPLNSLIKVRKTLSSSGLAYIAVPDMMSPKGSLGRYFFRVPHVSYFSLATLEYFILRAGLEIMEIKSQDAELWCVVKRGVEDMTIEVNPENTLKQLKLIRKYKRSQMFVEFKSFIARLIGRE